MTDIFAPASVDTDAASVDRPTQTRSSRTPRTLLRLAGAALIGFPVAFAVGMLTSPAQTEPGEAGYIASLAGDPFLSILSANFLHYAWVLLALSVLAVLALVGRRGRVWVSIAAVVVAFGAVQMSGLLLSDWFLIGAGNALPMDQALAMNEAAKEASAAVWLLTAQAGTLLGLPALSLGLARARVVSWWIAPLPLLAFVVPMFNLGAIAAVAFVPLMAPFLVAGVKLLRR